MNERLNGAFNNKEAMFRWLRMDTKSGCPFNYHFPIIDPSVSFLLQNELPGAKTPFSRWTLGRKKNPDFSVTGSGLEGHLCALNPMQVKELLRSFQDDAYRIVKQDVGLTLLNKYLDNQDALLSLKFIRSMKMAFDIVLAKARAIRGMSQRGYTYDRGGQMITLPTDRISRSSRYQGFIYTMPLIVNWSLFSPENGVIALNQDIVTSLDKLPLPLSVETIGGDIGYNSDLKLIAELGRFGHPLVSLMLRNLDS